MQNSQIRKIAYTALLIACDVLLTRVLAINTPVMKIGLGFVAVAVCGALYGPVWAAVAAAMGDFIGSMVFPTGAYFFGFTLTAALTGLIFGLLLKDFSRKKAITAAVLNAVLVSYIINSALIAYISGTSYAAMLATRVVSFLVMLVLQIFVLSVILPKIIGKIT